MKWIRSILFIVFTFISAPYLSYAAFPVRVPLAVDTAVVATAAPVVPSAVKHKSAPFFSKASNYINKHIAKRESSSADKPTLSILSFCLGLLAMIMVPVALISIVGSVAAFVVLLGLGLIFGLASLILGITALAGRKSLKGLAIAGIVLGAIALLELTGIGVILLIFGW